MPNIDGLKPTSQHHFASNPIRPKLKRKFFWWLLFLIVLIGLGTGAYKLWSKTSQIFENDTNPFTRIGKFFVSSDKTLQGEEEGKVNILLLGMGGPDHEGPLLTDTMIVAQINTKNNDVVLVSLPRDFLVQLPTRGFSKINAAYAYAEQGELGSGGKAAIAAVEKVTGLTVPYYATIDFKGFVKSMDHVGGIDVVIDRTFTDSQYPDYKNWYLPPVTFKAGFEHMNGERALIFARSRKGSNNEGSDFARSERQKKVIVGFKEKISQLNLTDVKTINNLLSDFTQNFRTNLEPFEIKRLAELGKKVSGENVYSLSLSPQNNLICDGIIGEYTNRAYVIQPCEGKSLQDIHEFVAQSTLIAKLKKENAEIEIQNSTGKSSAITEWKALSNAGFNIKFTTFKGKVSYERTILYDNSGSTKPNTLDYLKSNYDFNVSDISFTGSTSDIVIVIGQDAL